MPKAAGKEHLQHRLYKVILLQRAIPKPRFETIRASHATFEYDKDIPELRISTTGNQQFVWGKDLRDLKNLLRQEVQPPARRRRKEHRRYAARRAQSVTANEEERIPFDQWAIQQPMIREDAEREYRAMVEDYPEYFS